MSDQENFWEQMTKKYECRNEELRKREVELKSRSSSSAPQSSPCSMFVNFMNSARSLLPNISSGKRSPNGEICSCDDKDEEKAVERLSPQPLSDIRECKCIICQSPPPSPLIVPDNSPNRTFFSASSNNQDNNLYDCACNDHMYSRRLGEELRNYPCEGEITTIPSPNQKKLSLFSLKSCDLEQMKRIIELVQAEKDTRSRIKELEYRNFGANSNHLIHENNLLKNELEDTKLELKQQLENVKGPMKHKLEQEHYKCQKLESQLKEIFSEINKTQDVHLRELNSMKMQLCCACTNITELSSTNERLRDDLKKFEAKYQKLEEELVRQKLSEAHTIEQLINQMEKLKSMDNGDEECGCCDEDLYKIARKLSKTLKDSQDCGECSNVPSDIATAAKCIKELADLVGKTASPPIKPMTKSVRSPKSSTPRPVVQNDVSKFENEDIFDDSPVPNMDDARMNEILENTVVENTLIENFLVEETVVSSAKSKSLRSPKLSRLPATNNPLYCQCSVSQKRTQTKPYKYKSSDREKKLKSISMDKNFCQCKSVRSPRSSTPKPISTDALNDNINITSSDEDEEVMEDPFSVTVIENLPNLNDGIAVEDTYLEHTLVEDISAEDTLVEERIREDKKSSPEDCKCRKRKRLSESTRERSNSFGNSKSSCICPNKSNPLDKLNEVNVILCKNKPVTVPDCPPEVKTPCSITDITEKHSRTKMDCSCLPKSTAQKIIEWFTPKRTSTPCSQAPKKKCTEPEKPTCSCISKKSVSVKDSGETSDDNEDSKGMEIQTITSTHANSTVSSTKITGTGETHLPLNVDTQIEVLDKKPDGVYVTTSVTKSGTIQVITEGPEGVIETKLTYTDDGDIQILTEIVEENLMITGDKTEVRNMRGSNKDIPKSENLTSSR